MMIEQIINFLHRESNQEQADKQFYRSAERIIACCKLTGESRGNA